jgi:hypothetical protein
MEYIYLLQREMDLNYNVFKAGKTNNIKSRLKEASYRRANIYLIRGVSNSTDAENEVFKILNELEFKKAKTVYLNDDKLCNEFGDEDYVIKTDMYEIVNIVNKICDKYKYTLNKNKLINFDSLTNNKDSPKNEEINLNPPKSAPPIISDLYHNIPNLVKINEYNRSKGENDYKTQTLDVNNLLPIKTFISSKNLETDKTLDLKPNVPTVSKDLMFFDIQSSIQNKNINQNTNIININKINSIDSQNIINIDKINTSAFKPFNLINNTNTNKIKVDYEHFKKMFSSDRLLYIVNNRLLFETYYNHIINTESDIYSIESIMNITEIVYDRLFLKRSPKISSQPVIQTPYLTEVELIDKLLVVGINQNNIYDPLSIRFYVPNDAFKKEIQTWEISGVLPHPIKLKYFRSHGYNCYGFDNSATNKL